MAHTDNIPLTDRIDHSKNVPAETLEVEIIGDLDCRFTMPPEVESPAVKLIREILRDNAPSPAMHPSCVRE